MYRSILLPLDGSAFSEAAVPVAMGLSRKTGAAIRLLSVVEFFPTSAPYGWEDAARDQAAEYLADLAGRMGERVGNEVTVAAKIGHIPASIEAEAENSDLVVMASHGRGGISRAWLGSIADHVVRHLNRPVLLVRPEEAPEADLDQEWIVSKVLLPLDGSGVSEAILEHAIELGTLFGASYHLARVVPTPRTMGSSYPPHLIRANRERIQEEEEEATGYLQDHAESMRSSGLTVSYKVLSGGQPAHDILNEAQRTACDFIAISAHGRGSLARAVLGSTSDKVVRGSHSPVLLFRAGE